MEILSRSLFLGFCLTRALADSAQAQQTDETEADLALLEMASTSAWPKIAPLEPHTPQLLVRQEEDYTPLFLGAGIGALIGGIILCPVVSGSDTSCAGWVVTGALLGALAGSLL